MEHLPYVPSSILWEMLSARDLAALARTSRLLHGNVEPFLYRRHALTQYCSAAMSAVEAANSDIPETCTRALAILDKVKQFCHMAPNALNLRYEPRRAYIHLQTPRRFEDFGDPYSLTALHLAAWKGLDAIVERLLQGGSDVNCESSKATPLFMAVSNNKASTAVFLLSHGANPVVLPDPHNSLTVLHLACALGYADLAEQLLATGTVPADPIDVLKYYSTHLSYGYLRKDAPAVVELLARNSEFSAALTSEFIAASRWRSALALLQAKKRRNRISRSTATDLLDSACSTLRHRTLKEAEPVIRQLLKMGANPDVGQQILDSSTPDFPALLPLLSCLLNAGMDVAAKDFLGDASAYDRNQDEEGASAQLGLVRLLLQHGAPIGPATRGDALDSLGMRGVGRGEWAHKLCSLLVEHCRQIPRRRRRKDITAFLDRLSNANKRLEGAAFDIDFI